MTSTVYRLSRGPWFGFNGVFEFTVGEAELVVRQPRRGFLFNYGHSEAHYLYSEVRITTKANNKRLRLQLGNRTAAMFVARTTKDAQAFHAAVAPHLPVV